MLQHQKITMKQRAYRKSPIGSDGIKAFRENCDVICDAVTGLGSAVGDLDEEADPKVPQMFGLLFRQAAIAVVGPSFGATGSGEEDKESEEDGGKMVHFYGILQDCSSAFAMEQYLVNKEGFPRLLKKDHLGGESFKGKERTTAMQKEGLRLKPGSLDSSVADG